VKLATQICQKFQNGFSMNSDRAFHALWLKWFSPNTIAPDCLVNVGLESKLAFATGKIPDEFRFHAVFFEEFYGAMGGVRKNLFSPYCKM